MYTVPNKISGTLRIAGRKDVNGKSYNYVQLCWQESRKQVSISLGKYPTESPTALLDVAVMATYNPMLSVDHLRRLQAANKSCRQEK